MHDGYVENATLPTERIGENERAKNKERLRRRLSSQIESDKENSQSERQSTHSRDERHHSRHQHKYRSRERDRQSRDESRKSRHRDSESRMSNATTSTEKSRDHNRHDRHEKQRRERKEREKEESLKSSSDEESTNQRRERRRKSRDSNTDSDVTLTNENVAVITKETVAEVKSGNRHSERPKCSRKHRRSLDDSRNKMSSDESARTDKKDKSKRKSSRDRNKHQSDDENKTKDKGSRSKSSQIEPHLKRDSKVSVEKRRHHRSHSEDRQRENRKEDDRRRSYKSDKSSKDRKKKSILRRTSSASSVIDAKSGRNMRALPRTRPSPINTSQRQRKQDLLHHLEAQQSEVTKSEEFKMVAQMLINDVYLRKDKKIQSLIEDTYPKHSSPIGSHKNQSRRDNKSRDNASLPPVSPGSCPDSNQSIFTEPVRGSKKKPDNDDERPASALNMLYSEGSLASYSPRSAVHSYVPRHIPRAAQRWPTSVHAWQVSDAIVSSYEKEKLLQAVRNELRYMKQPKP